MPLVRVSAIAREQTSMSTVLFHQPIFTAVLVLLEDWVLMGELSFLPFVIAGNNQVVPGTSSTMRECSLSLEAERCRIRK